MKAATKRQKTVTIARVKQAVAGTSDVRRDLVERFRFLIQTGRYNVSNLEIADAILNRTMLGA